MSNFLKSDGKLAKYLQRTVKQLNVNLDFKFKITDINYPQVDNLHPMRTVQQCTPERVCNFGLKKPL